MLDVSGALDRARLLVVSADHRLTGEGQQMLAESAQHVPVVERRGPAAGDPAVRRRQVEDGEQMGASAGRQAGDRLGERRRARPERQAPLELLQIVALLRSLGQLHADQRAGQRCRSSG